MVSWRRSAAQGTAATPGSAGAAPLAEWMTRSVPGSRRAPPGAAPWAAELPQVRIGQARHGRRRTRPRERLANGPAQARAARLRHRDPAAARAFPPPVLRVPSPELAVAPPCRARYTCRARWPCRSVFVSRQALRAATIGSTVLVAARSLFAGSGGAAYRSQSTSRRRSGARPATRPLRMVSTM